MTVDDFLLWSQNQQGRYELYCGQVYAMSPERTIHGETKFAVQQELQRAIKTARLPCHMLPDGMTVRVGLDTAHEPDALVYCGDKLPAEDVEVRNPVIVVEVLSPSTRYIDASAKLEGYFRLASVKHYLIINPGKRPVILHSRQSNGSILTSMIGKGKIPLSPPGLQISVAKLFPK
jgi:Uma2 family endonuclease